MNAHKQPVLITEQHRHLHLPYIHQNKVLLGPMYGVD